MLRQFLFIGLGITGAVAIIAPVWASCGGDLGFTSRASVQTDGTQYSVPSDYPDITPDGRFMLFVVPNNDGSQLYLRDRDFDEDGRFDETGAGETKTIAVSVNDAGQLGDRASGYSNYYVSAFQIELILGRDVSSDGRFVIFSSNASNLGGTIVDSKDSHIYLHDRDPDEDGVFDEPAEIETGRVDCSSTGVRTTVVDMSDDANVIAFFSRAFPGVCSDEVEMYLYVLDRDGFSNTRITQNNYAINYDTVGVSGNGRYIAYSADPNGPVGSLNVYDRTDQSTIELIPFANDELEDISISTSGRYLCFATDADDINASPTDTNAVKDVFLVDRGAPNGSGFFVPANLTIRRVSVSENDPEENDCESPAMSASGRYVTFTTFGKLLSCDTNTHRDIYQFDRQAAQNPKLRLSSLRNNGEQSEWDCIHSSVSNGGNHTAFVTHDSSMVTGDTNQEDDVFIRKE